MSGRRRFGDGGLRGSGGRGVGDHGRGDRGHDDRRFGGFDDGGHDVPVDLLDDATIDAIVDGEPVDPRFGYLVGFADEARLLGNQPAPQPSAALAALIERGGAPGERAPSAARTFPANGKLPATRTPPVSETLPATRRRRSRRTVVAARVAGLGLVAKVAVAASVSTAGVAAAGATGVLPDPAARQVRHAIEVTTPFEFREPADDNTTDRPLDGLDAGTGDEPGEAPGAGQPADRPGGPARPSEPRADQRDAQGRAEPDAGQPAREPAGPQDGRPGERPTPDESRPGARNDPELPDKAESGKNQGQGPTGSQPSDDKGPETPK